MLIVVKIMAQRQARLFATAPKPGAGGGDSRERQVTAANADAARLQSQLLALADTALARLTAATTPGASDKDPEVRRFSLTTRLTLGTALIAIVTGPDPVDALLDMLTHATLVADGMRNEARGKPAESPRVFRRVPCVSHATMA
jgi:hypothetical protein